jgi:hypothetical protein
VASQLIEEVTAHAQRDSLEDAREICADGTFRITYVYIYIYIYIYNISIVYIYINSTNIPPIMIINRIYEAQNLLSL